MGKFWKWQLYLLAYATLALLLTPQQSIPSARTLLGIIIYLDICLLCWSLGLACQRSGTRAVWQALARVGLQTMNQIKCRLAQLSNTRQHTEPHSLRDWR